MILTFVNIFKFSLLEYVRPLSVNGPDPLTQQKQCRRLNNMKNTTQAVYVETSLLKRVKPRPITQNFQPFSLIFTSKSETTLQQREKKLLISQPSNNSTA